MSAYRRDYNARNRAKSQQAARQSTPITSASPQATPYTIIAPEWDEEAIETAREQAHQLLDLDPNDATAIMQIRKAKLAEQRLRGELPSEASGASPLPDAGEAAPATPTATDTPTTTREPFDPMQMFAQLAHYYPSFSDERMRRMPWKRLLAYKREAERMIEAENKAIKDAQHGHGQGNGPAQAMVDGRVVDTAVAEARLRQSVTHAQPYAGPLAPVGA